MAVEFSNLSEKLRDLLERRYLNFHRKKSLYFYDEKENGLKIDSTLRHYLNGEARINYFEISKRSRELFFMQMKLKGNEVYRITHAWYRNKKNKSIVFELEEIVNDGGIKGRYT